MFSVKFPRRGKSRKMGWVMVGPGICRTWCGSGTLWCRCRCQHVCIRTPLFCVVYPGIAAVVCSALGQACLIVVLCLHRYSTFNSAKVQYTAYYVERYWLTTRSWKNASVAMEIPGKVVELFLTKRVGTVGNWFTVEHSNSIHFFAFYNMWYIFATCATDSDHCVELLFYSIGLFLKNILLLVVLRVTV